MFRFTLIIHVFIQNHVFDQNNVKVNIICFNLHRVKRGDTKHTVRVDAFGRLAKPPTLVFPESVFILVSGCH